MNNRYEIFNCFKQQPKIFAKALQLSILLLLVLPYTSSVHANNTWALVGDLNTPRSGHTSTQLNANQILITDGLMVDTLLSSTEILNLNTGQWSYSTNMVQARRNHAASLLDNGQVLVVGGYNNDGTSIVVFREGVSSAPPPATTSLHITDLDDVSVLAGNLWTPAVTVEMRDDVGEPKSSAWITGTWVNGLSGFFSCTTDINGRCTGTYPGSIDTSTAPTGDVTISNITYSTFPYNSSANADPDGDSDGTHIVLQAPPVTDPAPTPTPEPVPEPTPVPITGTHVNDLDGYGEKKDSRRWRANVDITVVDHTGNLVANASVTGNWSGGASGSDNCSTDSSGTCKVRSDRARTSKPTITFTVTTVSHATLNYIATANSDADGDSDGTRITIARP